MRFFAYAMLAAGVVAPVVAAQGTVPGFYTESKVTTRVEGSRKGRVPVPTEHVTRNWRIAGVSRSEGGFSSLDTAGNGYSVSRWDDRKTYQVSPSTRTIRVAPFDGPKGGVASPFAPPTPLHVTYRELGDGGTILGHRTVRWESRVSFQAPANLQPPPGVAQTGTFVMTYWIAFDMADPMVASWSKTIGQVADDTARHLPRGKVLRLESRSEMLGVVSTVTEAVTAWRRESIDTSLFVLPAGWRRVQSSDVLPNRQAISPESLATLKALLAAQRSMLDEVNRLRGSTSPKDKARLQFLMDSMLKAMRPDSARLRQMIHNDPNAIRITDSTAVKRKP